MEILGRLTKISDLNTIKHLLDKCEPFTSHSYGFLVPDPINASGIKFPTRFGKPVEGLLERKRQARGN